MSNSVTLGMTLHPFWLQLQNANRAYSLGLQCGLNEIMHILCLVGVCNIESIS